jgi:hypothetical protein
VHFKRYPIAFGEIARYDYVRLRGQKKGAGVPGTEL